MGNRNPLFFWCTWWNNCHFNRYGFMESNVLCGGIAGLALYFGRGKIKESSKFLYAKEHSEQKFGSMWLL